MFFSVGNDTVSGTLAIQGFQYTDASWKNNTAQFGIGQGWVEFNSDLGYENIHFNAKAGSFWGRYGMAGKYDAGEYDTYLFGRTHALGGQARVEIGLDDEYTLGLEGGLGCAEHCVRTLIVARLHRPRAPAREFDRFRPSLRRVPRRVALFRLAAGILHPSDEALGGAPRMGPSRLGLLSRELVSGSLGHCGKPLLSRCQRAERFCRLAGIEQYDGPAVGGEEERGREAGDAGADDADVGGRVACQGGGLAGRAVELPGGTRGGVHVGSRK